MNLPNKLTIFRVILIPLFVLCLYLDRLGLSHANVYQDFVALGIFIIASLTDLFDGKIARKYHMVTDFGKFMDPLADKLLVCTALICLLDLQRIPCVVVIIIIAREFIISGFRLVAADNGLVLAASYWGKFKTTFQMIMVCFMIADIPAKQFSFLNDYVNKGISVFTTVVMWIALALTIISLMDYLIKNKSVLKEQK